MVAAWKIAIIATSHALMGGTGEETGVWLEELTTPYYALADKGIDVDIYSIGGGSVPIDPRSLKPKGGNDASVERYLGDEKLQRALRETKSIADLNTGKYDAVFLPGGHGTMWDFPDSARLAEIVSQSLESGRVVGAVCHGPAGLISAKYADGTPVVKGKKVAGFTNTEEEAVGLTKTVPFLLEDRLKELGAKYASGPDFEPFAVRDGLLVTGQNPASAETTVEQMIEALHSLEAAGN
ncbi:MAG: type 1 glutamine amidotransferase domain-containing protein [Pseudomonadota bacterium]